MLVWLLKMEIGTNLINLEFWLWWASPGRNPDLRNRLRRRREKGLNDFRAGGDSGTAGTGRRGRLWFEAQSRTNPWEYFLTKWLFFENLTLMDWTGITEFLWDRSELLGAGRTDRTVSGGKLVFVTFRNWSFLRGREGICCFLGLKILLETSNRSLAYHKI